MDACPDHYETEDWHFVALACRFLPLCSISTTKEVYQVNMQFVRPYLFFLLFGSSLAYNVAPSGENQWSRRSLLKDVATIAAGGALASFTAPGIASASGGATAGKYT